jgi:hypothetical protein
LKDTEAVIDENDKGRVDGILQWVKHHFSYSFGGEVPLKVLDFLSTVKEAMYLNHVSERVAAVVLPYLLTCEAKDGVIAMWKSSSPKVPKYPAAVAWLLESYATDAAIDAAADKLLTAKQNTGEGEDAFASRLRRHATEAGNVYKEDALVSRYLAGLPSYTANTIRGQVSPRMRFTQVKNLAVQAGIAGKEAGVSNFGYPRPPIPGLLTRPRGVVATLAGSPYTSSSTHAPPPFNMMDEALVAAAEYEQCEGNTSMMSGPSSDVSFPSRGWASVAASVQGYPDSAVMARARGCHVCFRMDHFLMDCPLLPPEVKQAITTQRTQKIQQDRGVIPGRVNPPAPSPSATSLTSGVAPFTGGVAPVARPAPQFLRSAYIPTTTWGPTPRYANSGRSYPTTVAVNPVQPMAQDPEEPTSMVTPTAENFLGDV